MSKQFIEPFAQFAARGRGVPWLATLANRKTMHVDWGDGTLRDYSIFKSALDQAGMLRALSEIWQRHRPQCDRRACFYRGEIYGGMAYVPIESGEAAAAIVRDHFNHALDHLLQHSNDELARRTAQEWMPWR